MGKHAYCLIAVTSDLSLQVRIPDGKVPTISLPTVKQLSTTVLNGWSKGYTYAVSMIIFCDHCHSSFVPVIENVVLHFKINTRIL